MPKSKVRSKAKAKLQHEKRQNQNANQTPIENQGFQSKITMTMIPNTPKNRMELGMFMTGNHDPNSWDPETGDYIPYFGMSEEERLSIIYDADDAELEDFKNLNITFTSQERAEAESEGYDLDDPSDALAYKSMKEDEALFDSLEESEMEKKISEIEYKNLENLRKEIENLDMSKLEINKAFNLVDTFESKNINRSN
jgi:hypothetical protein